jgi:hypothetical protein
MKVQLTNIFGDDVSRWCISSNYEYSKSGDFDVMFINSDDAMLYMTMYPQSVRLDTNGKQLYKDANPQLAMFEW